MPSISPLKELDEQLYTAFEKLFLSDHAQDEYEHWVRDAPKIPFVFRQLTGINLCDPTQCSQIVFPPLQLAKRAIDFYMSHVVFPEEMKEFPHKLSSSGWDIARTKGHPTTGFSGTNDSVVAINKEISLDTLSLADFKLHLRPGYGRNGRVIYTPTRGETTSTPGSRYRSNEGVRAYVPETNGTSHRGAM